MAIEIEIRKATLYAWGNRCFYCGKDADEVDHVIPLEKDGMDDPRNLVAACRVCNQAKGNCWLPYDVITEALDAAAILAPFVRDAANVFAKSLMVADERAIYGSLPLRDGVKGRAHVSPGERQMQPARDVAKWGVAVRKKYFGTDSD